MLAGFWRGSGACGAPPGGAPGGGPPAPGGGWFGGIMRYLATPNVTSGKSSSPVSFLRTASIVLMTTWYGIGGFALIVTPISSLNSGAAPLSFAAQAFSAA